LRRYAMFLDVVEREWVRYGYLLDELSGARPINVAAARARIVLGDSSLVDSYCRPRYCIPLSEAAKLGEALDKAMDIFSSSLANVFSDRRMSEAFSRRRLTELDASVSEAIAIMDMYANRIEMRMCRDLGALACFVASKPIYIDSKRIDPPAILINVAGVEELIDSIDVIQVRDRYTMDSLRNKLLASILIHEVLHSFTDMSPESAPRNRLREVCRGAYHTIIEESLATYYTLKYFLENPSGAKIMIVARLLNELPLEYRSGLTLLHSLQDPVNLLLRLWTRLLMLTHDYLEMTLHELIHVSSYLFVYSLPQKVKECLWLPPFRSRLVRSLVSEAMALLKSVDVRRFEMFLWRALALQLARSAPTVNLYHVQLR